MKRVKGSLVAVAAALAVAAGSVSAQVETRKVLNLEGAKRIAQAAVAEARRGNAPGGAIAIVDDGGQLVYLERLDNTFAAAAPVAIEKARTAAQFRRPTRVFEDAIKGGRLALLGVAVMTPLQGGVPIMVDGQMVGAIGVSGAASAQQDDEIAQAASTALDKQTGASR